MSFQISSAYPANHTTIPAAIRKIPLEAHIVPPSSLDLIFQGPEEARSFMLSVMKKIDPTLVRLAKNNSTVTATLTQTAIEQGKTYQYLDEVFDPYCSHETIRT